MKSFFTLDKSQSTLEFLNKVFLIGDFGSGAEYMWVLFALILREELFNLWSSTLVAVFTT